MRGYQRTARARRVSRAVAAAGDQRLEVRIPLMAESRFEGGGFCNNPFDHRFISDMNP
jgi:hypothetical protein